MGLGEKISKIGKNLITTNNRPIPKPGQTNEPICLDPRKQFPTITTQNIVFPADNQTRITRTDSYFSLN